ncbi:MAG: enoyl-CoA hydratase/isomerase family protein [Betaproteobacteria bacterium]|nr:enoyl-CoA hydratase/isomerase family protein [Betaproteobacteria bacterium]
MLKIARAASGALARTLDIFEIFGAVRRPLSLSEIARTIGAPASSCHMLLRTLLDCGYLYSFGRRKLYYPTRRLYDVACSITAHDALIEELRPALIALRDRSGETVILGKRQGDAVLYLEVLESPNTVRYTARVGEYKPLHSSAIGKALLGALSPAELDAWFGSHALPRITAHTLTSTVQLKSNLVRHRHRRAAAPYGTGARPSCRAVARDGQPPYAEAHTMSDRPTAVIAGVADGVLEVTINRPERRNALSRAVLAELKSVFVDFANAEDLRVAVLRGAGEKSFAAGGDLRDLAAVRTREEARRMADEAHDALDAIRFFPLPVVAALNGDALGGGAELAVACDFRVAAGHAHIGFIHGRLNIATAWGGGEDLMRLVGVSNALRLLAASERLDAAAAQRIGLVNAVAAPNESFQAEIDRFIAPFRQQVPQVLRAFKALATAVRRGVLAAAIREIETCRLVETWVHPDHWHAADNVLNARGPT